MDLGQAREILNYAHSAFISMDENGRIVYWNIRAEEMFGISRADALGRELAETVIPPRYREPHKRGLERYLRTGEAPVLNERLEMSAIDGEGREFPVELTITALAEGERFTFSAFILDISDRKRAEQERQQLLDELELSLRGTEERLAVIVDALAEAVTIRGPDDRLIHANRAALERIGLSSVEELRAADPHALMGEWETVTEDGSAIAMEDLPSVRVLRGLPAEPLLMRSVHRRTGEEQWVVLKATAVRDVDGSIQAAVTIIEDITSAKRAALRMEFLARASQLLASSLDYQETLSNVAGLAVPQIADWCGLDLIDPDRGREPVAVAHIDPSKLEMAERLRAFEPDELDLERGIGLVWRTGEPSLFNDIPDELLVQAARDEEHLALLRAVGMRAVLIVPMTVRTRTIGTLTLVSAESGRVFDRSDVEFAQQIAERAAMAVENARLYSERSEVARTLQNSLLPDALPEIPGWEIAAMYRPAGHESEVGGDFYDLWEVEGEWLMMIGDVTGKGVGAAALTALVRHTAWAASEFDSRPAQVLTRVDRALKRGSNLSVCTALCLRIRESRGTLASGGHPLLLHLGERGVSEVGSHGTLLGAFSEVDWPEAPLEMRPGETLLAFTDGVTDTVGEGDERFGMDRLKEILEGAQNGSPMEIRERLVAALQDFQVGAQADDTAIVVMRYAGDQAERDRQPQHPERTSTGSQIR